MNEKDYKPDERLEGMLRRWGADESARRAGVPPMPAMSPQQRWRMILLRWAPLVAAAMLLIAVGLFLAGKSDDKAAAPTDELQTLKTELARTKADLQTAHAQLAQPASRPTEELDQLKTELASLKKTFEEEKNDFVERANQRIAALDHIIGEKDAQLKALDGQLEENKKLQAAMNEHFASLTTENDRNKTKLAAAASELDRVGKTYRQTLADSQKVQAELLALKFQHQVVLADFQRAYLTAAAAAGGMEYAGRRIDLGVRQSAARSAGLLERCAELRPSVQATATGLLMDRLEVVLTKLNLLNPADTSEAEAFAALLRHGGLVKEIDVALAEGDRRADVRAWLLEARMILEGAENVG